MSFRIFHATVAGDIINAHGCWRRNEHCPTEVSITFSSQFEQFCEEIGAEAYIVSTHPRKDFLKDDAFTLEHRPKPRPGARGLMYHLAEITYGLGLLATAIRFRADVAVMDSGSTYYFLTTLFRLFGILRLRTRPGGTASAPWGDGARLHRHLPGLDIAPRSVGGLREESCVDRADPEHIH
jgi:hypothetical protein